MELSAHLEKVDQMLDVAVAQSAVDGEPNAMFALLMVHAVILAQALHQAGACTKHEVERLFREATRDALVDAPEITLDS